MAKKAAEILEINKLVAVVDAGYDSATDIMNCIEHGIDAHVAKAEFTVCIPRSKEESQVVSPYIDGCCVYVSERNLALCPMGQVMYPSSHVKKTKDASFYNSRMCGRCVCRCSKGVKIFSMLCVKRSLVGCMMRWVCMLSRLG